MEIEYRIPLDDCTNIRSLIGVELSEILYRPSTGLSAQIVSHMVILKITEGRHIRIFTDEWSDTQREGINCFRLRAEEVANPAYANSTKTNEPIEIGTLPIQNTIIIGVDIYEFRDSEGDESVIYLEIRVSNRKKFKIMLDNGGQKNFAP